ncbi:MAG: hypothetical protein A3G18_07890 [Rhodospirillales bacterium RIFCSPLOWO2_12_FULL_58_28]|nr:MAG: hypothetical protein A3H92_05850 [Rhodospirillales bacterium RIFCSPLOWO2_02_FULL_58_16]OHC78367.1 MAG: hypothetical protein A3G18_07890 [Rhodospirillales bacterium RIFCSPLOWO2_12_FULL_58_28]
MTEGKPAERHKKEGDRLFASPLARRMAEQAGLDLGLIRGSGPHGRIVRKDVEAVKAGNVPMVVASGAAAPLKQAFTEAANSTMRKVIAKRLSEAKRDIPHFYLTIDCRIDSLLETRKALNSNAPEGAGSYHISVNDFVIRAAALALRRVPAANASWTEQAILIYNEVDVAVAVATPGGLVTPVLRRADAKGLGVISNEIKELSARARDGKLAPEEYQGGGFTITNLGMFGIKEFSAIINPPQSCILAVGAGERRPVVIDGALAIATVMTCTLSVDHRSVDGVIGAQFLAAFRRYIEEPLTMLL